MYSVMWSEHCSYKSSKVHLKQFGEKVTDEMREHLMVGIGENAGVVDIGDGYAVTFKIESHNHPSYVEPYQGAATGVGGIVRDILAMGARPVAVMDPLRFGPLDAPDTHRVLPGIVAGVGGYGNCLGLPNIGGEAVFDATYAGNPLVNALCVGVMRHEQIHLAKASGAGNQVILYGAQHRRRRHRRRLACSRRETFESTGPAKRPSVQVGDPFQEKLLIECTLEIFAEELVVGIQDLGGAGLSCATSELASAGDGGMHVWLDRVPLRDSTLAPEEILMSESQERMMAVVEPADVDALPGDLREVGRRGHRRRRGRRLRPARPSSGTARPSSTCRRGRWRTTARPTSAPSRGRPGRTRCRPTTAPALARPDDRRRAARRRCCGWSRSPNLCDKSWITDQYDRYVQGNTVLAQPEDSGMVRVDADSGLGVAVSTDCNGRFAMLDPYAGAQLALAESYRNVATSGARPLAVSDCLNFGSPEDPDVMWQFAEATRGLADGCQALGIPVTGGNVSLYNQTGDDRDPADAGRRRARRDRRRGAPYAVGVRRRGPADLPARRHPRRAVRLGVGARRARPPRRPAARGRPGRRAGARRHPGQRLARRPVDAAHDLSDGGLAQALVESCLRNGVGARVWLPDDLDPFVALFSESAGRAIVAVPRSEEVRFTDMCSARGFPHARIGVTDGAGADAGARRPGPVRACRWRSSGPPGPRPSPPPSAEAPRRSVEPCLTAWAAGAGR